MRARPLAPPSLALLSELRERAAAQVLERHRARIEAFCPALSRGDADAKHALSDMAEVALSEMRERVRSQAADEGWRTRWASDLHSWWADTDAEEYLDNPDLDRRMRVRLLDHLDQLNAVMESYPAFFEQLRPLLRSQGTTRVLDLAAGHGGFALAAARIARRHGLDVELTASDLRREYLDLGEPVARRENLPVRFAVQDALDLGNLSHGEYDIVTCTQSLHHFPVGLAAIMLSEALRAATRGVVFVDGCRSLVSAAAVGGLCLLRWADAAFAHDAIVSFRRFYTPEELGLVARLTPWGDRAEARFLPPGFVSLYVDKGG